MTTNVSRKKASRPAKPSKTYPEFPLTANPNGLNVGDLFNRFLDVKAGLVETGEIAYRMSCS